MDRDNALMKEMNIEKWDLTKYDVKSKKSVDTLAKEVIQGKWGNGDERKKYLWRFQLTAAGYDYNAVQKTSK
jgi:hypothetical protein